MKLEFENVDAAYGETQILNDVNFGIEEGEIVGIMGKNGVGKTTLLKTAMGLLPPAGGTIRFDGEDISDLAADERARKGIGYIPQKRDVFPNLTVEQNLAVGETINTESEETLYEEVYRYFPILEERRGQKAGQMSGGQQQMLAIGRALIGNPDLLLLDEPSEGVQPSIIQDITENLKQVQKDLDTTILFVEQNLGVIQNLADRCYAIDHGTIVDELTGDQLQNRELLTEHLVV